MENIQNTKNYEIKKAPTLNGWVALLILTLVIGAAVGLIIVGALSKESNSTAFLVSGFILFFITFFLYPGFFIIRPNECAVLTLFGNYLGLVNKEGFHYVNPFAVSFNPTVIKIGKFSKKVSLKIMTSDNKKQKVNDLDGNPIEIGVISIWRVVDPAKAVFNVDNYFNYLAVQSDAAIRNIARQYPYDLSDNTDDVNEKSLRGSSKEISEVLKLDLQQRIANSGIEILETRISHLAYAEEIASAMLQRQQANAVVQAREKIVEGATGMVKMALDNLKKDEILFKQDQVGKLVANLMVVLCSSREANSPVNK